MWHLLCFDCKKCPPNCDAHELAKSLHCIAWFLEKNTDLRYHAPAILTYWSALKKYPFHVPFLAVNREHHNALSNNLPSKIQFFNGLAVLFRRHVSFLSVFVTAWIQKRWPPCHFLIECRDLKTTSASTWKGPARQRYQGINQQGNVLPIVCSHKFQTSMPSSKNHGDAVFEENTCPS